MKLSRASTEIEQSRTDAKRRLERIVMRGRLDMCKHGWDWREYGPCPMCADENSKRVRENLSRYIDTGLEVTVCNAHNQIGVLMEVIAKQRQLLRECAEIMRRSDAAEFDDGTQPVNAAEWSAVIERAEHMCLTPNAALTGLSG